MKKLLTHITFGVILLFGGVAVAQDPCWSQTNSCGDLPLCTNPTLFWSNCSHVYCDSSSTCTSDSSKKRVMEKSRQKRYWISDPGELTKLSTFVLRLAQIQYLLGSVASAPSPAKCGQSHRASTFVRGRNATIRPLAYVVQRSLHGGWHRHSGNESKTSPWHAIFMPQPAGCGHATAR